ncbi:MULTISPECIES: DUF1800 family protein [unclassified Polaribacter]|uniref:DUF1800 domain-containing protein n=1 Tax=unclassified Polaribacter TaxID=196858 RepID=UPI0011BF1666|nr:MULTISPECIES: DUF1800 domain-containing protein [unclassified Polaribacter]TXD51355.1 DUF1800 domain-containing protein [Polaribacter sp. IC063]TXD61989.1 DUF1800 domain-containing protein [Polaribacter sp. IC066]
MKQKHLQHLYWRASFGIGAKEITHLKSEPKSKIVSKLLLQSNTYEPLQLDLSEFLEVKFKSNKELKEQFTALELQELKRKQQRKVKALNYAWIERLRQPTALLREKMTLFWSNVFVCRDNDIFFIQRYNNILRQHALGDFRNFVKAIAREPSMSKYLNNRQNVKRKPNENFARELMELFTLGLGNYTEQDVKEAARAFTGWSFKRNGDFYVKEKQHDFKEKTFLGKTGNFDGDDIIDIILEQKQCARFICDKIYTYFINPKIDKKRLEEITAVFYKDYNIGNLMEYIFKSNWFYNEENIGVKIKSPLELLVGIQKVVPVTFHKEQQLIYLQKMMGQTLLYPTNVAGWKGGKSWIDANTLMFRMKLASLILNNAVINLEEKGAFEDSFEKYYQKTKNSNKFIKTTKNWEVFDVENKERNASQLTNLLVLSKLDKDTEAFLESLQIKSNRNFCVQLMSIPEYQLC